MKQKIIILIILIQSIQCLIYSQDEIKSYVGSFPLLDKNIIQTNLLIFEGIEAEKEEALKYIYNGDTNKLFCIEIEYDMITEKINKSYKYEKLPKKCGKISLDSLILIFYTTYDCQKVNSSKWVNLHLSIYTTKYILLKDIIVHRENEYDTEVSSLINCRSQKIFQYSYNKEYKSKEFILLDIETNNPYVIKEKTQFGKYTIDNLYKTIEKLGWEDKFNSQLRGN